ncbi:hypothetical protein B4125_3655 [Bacillus paralicheniformis]|nr:hypothetical protein SC10_B2orf01191 [Bacillus paralicheniformis]OLG03411.1 hypothetical protein B4125_3655 [Bacillus paralicheniformis]TWM03163.1 hypothetical protein CHCC15136_0460 [Bacillus paralicheniformis]TWM54530.1 hypothetical protein CHCC14817_3957 [Bacillus paralicheniformis]TWN66367.1 hypothetical protein CHCC12620_2772 [Bacillus paralicheniformis]
MGAACENENFPMDAAISFYFLIDQLSGKEWFHIRKKPFYMEKALKLYFSHKLV